MRSASAWIRLGAVLALVGPGSAAQAAGFTLEARIDGIASGHIYPVSRYAWAHPFEVSFTHPTDASSVAFLAAAQSHAGLGNATVSEALQGTAVVTLQMAGVRVLSVQEAGDAQDAWGQGPLETVTLGFRSITYTYQPVNPVGQPAGPPVSFTWSR